MCCSPSYLYSQNTGTVIRIGLFTVFPREISLKVLGYLDAIVSCRAAQVSKHWKGLADDDILWRGICEQPYRSEMAVNVDGSPILERRLTVRSKSSSPCPSQFTFATTIEKGNWWMNSVSPERLGNATIRNFAIARMRALRLPLESSDSPSPQPSSSNCRPLTSRSDSPSPPVDSVTRPWRRL